MKSMDHSAESMQMLPGLLNLHLKADNPHDTPSGFVNIFPTFKRVLDSTKVYALIKHLN